MFKQTPKKGSGDVKKSQKTSKVSKKDKKIYETLRAPSETNFVIFHSISTKFSENISLG